jgi:hypothetical protein
MTRRDYILLSSALARTYADVQRRGALTAQAAILLVAESIADDIARTNPTFDRQRFIADAIPSRILTRDESRRTLSLPAKEQ